MKKILVTTDLSNNSKAAIRFAIQLASQSGDELIFYYANSAFIIDPWATTTFVNLPEPDIKKQEQTLIKFIQTLYRQTRKHPGKINYITENKLDITNAIIDCAKKIKADYICVSTRGGGLINKILGSHTTKILSDSPIPVLVVPKYYRMKPLTSVFYPSDLQNIASELQLIKKFASSFNASITVYHYDYFTKIEEINKKLNEIQSKFQSEKITFHFKNLSTDLPLLRHVQIDIIKTRPSVITMFAKENRSWFEQLFQSFKTSEKGFDSKTPTLVFRK